ncbi:MAG: hypothetical protein IT243_06690 [Bacteroidia bacterium]|nr:hypothetical protein [Bacteroidia bacterium]
MCYTYPSFLGDANKYNPEEQLLASVSTCQMFWCLHLCAIDGVVVSDCSDNPT